MNLAIIGAGLIGKKRALALPKNVRLSAICDIDEIKGKKFAEEFACTYKSDWKEVVKDPTIQALVISTTNNWLSPIAAAAILRNKHVLIEKPGAKNINDFNKIIKAYKKNPVVVMFGYNHRYHPSIIKAKNIVDSKKYGDILFIRARYGHGARLEYEKEWRFQKNISGGGELLDQGSHLIDLTNYFLGRMDNIKGLTKNVFWKSELEDLAFLILQNSSNQTALLSATCVEWKNIFSFEIMLKTAKIQIDGLGRSYGKEKLTLYKMKPEMGPPDTKEFIFEGEDLSWQIENKLFFERIRKNDLSSKSLDDAYYVLKTINQIYKERTIK